MSNKYNGKVIADLHLGILPIEKQYEEIHDQIIENIKKQEKLDFLIIAGDFYDHKFYLNDKESVYAYNIIQEILYACREKKTKVRIVYGTESHEWDQYGIISSLELSDDIKVIKYVQEEELFPGMNVLYLPEEQIMDKTEYYSEFFKEEKKYDYVFGHGIIREAMTVAAISMENKSAKRKKVPVFTTAELSRICKGQVFFGHYHVNWNFNDSIFYVGSFMRWQFGEEASKGYYDISCDLDKEKYKATFIENTMTDIYKTIAFGYESKVFSDQEIMDKELSKVNQMIDGKLFDHVRFEFNIPETIENPEATINYLKEKYKFNDKVKVEITHGYAEKKKKIESEVVRKENEKYRFIFDKSLPLEDKSSLFIQITYDKYIPIDRVRDYLTKPLDEILEGIKDE